MATPVTKLNHTVCPSPRTIHRYFDLEDFHCILYSSMVVVKKGV